MEGLLDGTRQVVGVGVVALQRVAEKRDLAGHGRVVGAERGSRHALVQAEEPAGTYRGELRGVGAVLDHDGHRPQLRREGSGDGGDGTLDRELEGIDGSRIRARILGGATPRV